MKSNTKERILEEALKLFSKNGYAATSMSDIANELNITKAALYKHYKSKQDIFDSIITRMEKSDRDMAIDCHLPEEAFDKMEENYKNTTFDRIRRFTEAEFKHWTENVFSCRFRRMLTLEQYKNKQMRDLYQNYLASGPTDYIKDLFSELKTKDGKMISDPKQAALDFYGPIYLLISIYDSAEDKEEIISLFNNHINKFSKRFGF